jgi:hypothetical protein
LAATLNDLIPRPGPASSDELLGRFLEYVEGRKLQLYPAQETAVFELGDFFVGEEKNCMARCSA